MQPTIEDILAATYPKWQQRAAERRAEVGQTSRFFKPDPATHRDALLLRRDVAEATADILAALASLGKQRS